MSVNKSNYKYHVIIAHFFNPINDKKCEFLEDYAIVAKRMNGGVFKIVHRCPKSELHEYIKRKKDVEIIDKSGQFIIPGLYDTHFHWVQDDVREMPKANLLHWLENYTWPYEANFKKLSFARKMAKQFAQKIADNGTIGGACYGSIHSHSVTEALENFTGDYILGNVQMTMNSPEYLTMGIDETIAQTESLAQDYKERYAVTPRFAITTDPVTMSAGARTAKKHRSFIQTHLSETQNEIEFVLSIYKDIKGFEKVKTYTEIYDKVGLLTPKTIMGHGIYLSPKELKLLCEKQTMIAHCPTSNAPIKELGLGSGLFDYKRANRYGVHWALASDIGGGPFLSMLDVINSFVAQNHKRGHRDTSFTSGLYRATLAGAKSLKLETKSGNFEIGKQLNYVSLGAKKMRANLSAEERLKSLIKRPSKDRASYSDLIESTFFNCNLISAT